jgi:hypothetical protein
MFSKGVAPVIDYSEEDGIPEAVHPLQVGGPLIWFDGGGEDRADGGVNLHFTVKAIYEDFDVCFIGDVLHGTSVQI